MAPVGKASSGTAVEAAAAAALTPQDPGTLAARPAGPRAADQGLGVVSELTTVVIPTPASVSLPAAALTVASAAGPDAGSGVASAGVPVGYGEPAVRLSGPEAQVSSGSGGVPLLPTSAGSTPSTVSGVGEPVIALVVSTGVSSAAVQGAGNGDKSPGLAGGDGEGALAVPMRNGASGPDVAQLRPTVPPIFSIPVQPTPLATATGAPSLKLTVAQGETSAVPAVGDGGVVPGPTGAEAPAAGASSPGQHAGAATAATWTTRHPVVDTTVSGGPPSATGSGALPVTSSLVPSAAPLVASVTAARGMPVPSAFPEMVHQQVFTAVSPLLRGADGTYGIRLDLHPKDLGAVQVNLHVRHGEISIQMNAVDPAARDALRSGLSDLRQQFEDQGLRAGSMEVGSGGADARQPETAWSRSRGVELPNNARSPSEQQATTKVAASNTALDLRM